MAVFQIGDKVKFLNDVGGGIVTRITDDLVFVRDDSGFDMPMDPKELIRTADMQGVGRMFNENLDKYLPSVPKPLGQAKPKETPPTAEEEVKVLRAQVANLKDQVARLTRQLQQAQRANAQGVVDNVLAQHMIDSTTAEVDLHIERLAYDYADLPAHEAFATQMRYFRSCMNQAVANRVGKVIFICGVGHSILRGELLKELKAYDNVVVMDAPMSRYGVGAIEVYIK